ncbi:agmatinase [Truepera radiovictrix]|uniref:Agmatinase n=1 Tax=Truepera radiovictrix (strain DSM 17093 / CIP 108686 / LMG 22925 / RQ-24) TaxID=649638 RepID=D7CX25_TRURR|nr:agmatinase [Truepera radiovictrix]ADI14533.1 agmatinase [Truepera radiovictrix DSM 17093]WMT56916.1 agmatinase [Truepera radiovictrix]
MPRYRPPDAMVYPRFEGIRTFMRLPHVTDLAGAGIDAAIVGAPFDTGGTYRVGARFGPAGIRHESMLLRPYHPELRVDVTEQLSLVDYGDLPVTPGYLSESHAQLERGAAELVAAGVTPFFLGGDHSVSLPLLRAVAQRHGPVGLVHIDAHSDLWEGYFGGKDTHGTPFRRALEEGLLEPARSIQIGLRGSLYSAEDHALSQRLGFEMVTAPELHRVGVQEVARRVRARAGTGPLYLSFDIDALDPTFAPGTGTPEVGGLSSVQALALLRALAGLPFVAYDLVEVMPPYDVAGTTCLLAANLVYEMLALEACRRLGAAEAR